MSDGRIEDKSASAVSDSGFTAGISSTPWFKGAKRGFRFSVPLALPVLIWLGLNGLEVISENAVLYTAMGLTALLFILGLPLSIIVRYDYYAAEWAFAGSPELTVVGAFVVASLNFALLGALRGLLRGEKSATSLPAARKKAPSVSESAGNGKLKPEP